MQQKMTSFQRTILQQLHRLPKVTDMSTKKYSHLKQLISFDNACTQLPSWVLYPKENTRYRCHLRIDVALLYFLDDFWIPPTTHLPSENVSQCILYFPLH